MSNAVSPQKGQSKSPKKKGDLSKSQEALKPYTDNFITVDHSDPKE